MRLAREDELRGTQWMMENAEQPVRIVQQKIGPLVGRKASRETKGQCAWIELGLSPCDLPRFLSERGHLSAYTFTRIVHQGFSARGTHRPQLLVGNTAKILRDGGRRPKPPTLAADLGPKSVGRRRIPCRHVNPIGHVTDRNFLFRPAGEERGEDVSAHLAMQPADAVDRPASAHRQVGHVEGLFRVRGVPASQRQKLARGDAQSLLRIPTEVLLHQRWSKEVEARGNSRVGGKEISGAGGRQRDNEGISGRLHEAPCALQQNEGRVPFVEMTDLRLDPERIKQTPATHPEHDLLLQAQLRAASIQLACDAPVNWKVCRIIRIQQIQLPSANLDLPGAQPDGGAGQRYLYAQPLAIGLENRRDRQLPGVVVGVQGLLGTIAVDHLAKIPMLVQQSDAHHRHAKIAGRFELVAGDIPEPARIDGQRLTQHEFHAEIGNAREGRLGIRFLKPSRLRRRLALGLH